MARRPSRQSLSTGILIVLLAGVLVSQTLGASANHAPANKVVASSSRTQMFAPGTDVVLAQARFKTSKPTDLMIHFTAECSILTKLNTQGGDNVATENDKASGDVRVWVEIDSTNNLGVTTTRVVPIQARSEPPQDGSDPNSGSKATDNATFCNRTYERTVTDREDGNDGIDGEQDYIDTKTANAFNWVLLNAGSGIHTMRVEADLTAASTPALGTGQTCAPNTTTAQTCASAYVGNRVLIVESTKMSNDTTISEIGST